MPSEDRLRRKTLGSNNGISSNVDTYEDDEDVTQDDSELGTIFKIGLAALGLRYLHKAGVLKDIVKPLYDLGDVVAKNGGDAAYNVTKSIEKWASLKNLSPEELRTSKKQFYNAPEKSLFRDNGRELLKSLINDSYTSIRDGSFDLNKTKGILDDTIKDINVLNQIVEENKTINMARGRNYRDTSLIRDMEDMNIFFRELNNNLQFEGDFSKFNKTKELIKSDSTKEFVYSKILTDEKRKAALKRNGYRPLTLGDFLEVETGEDIMAGLRMKANSPINVMDSKVHGVDDTLDRINAFFQDPYKKYIIDGPDGGKITTPLRDWEHTKNMIFDPNIMTDEKGKIIDTRMSNEMITDFKRSLVNNFQIPVLGFNPLASITNWGRVNKESFAGLIGGEQIDPVLTGRAGRTTIRDVYKSDVVVFNNKAYKINQETGDLDFITDGIILNKVNDADSRGLNKKIDTVRKVGNLKYNEWAKYTDEELAQKTWLGRMIVKAQEAGDFGFQDKLKEKGIKFRPDGTMFRDEKTFAEYMNIENKFEEFIYDMTDKIPKPHGAEPAAHYTAGSVFGKFPDPVTDQKGNVQQANKYVTTRKSIKIADIGSQSSSEEMYEKLKDYVKQFGTGRDKNGNIGKTFTEASIRTYSLFDSIEERLGGISPLLGLSMDSKGNLGSMFKNVMLKRVLPIYLASQIPGVLNAISEPFFAGMNDDEDGTDNRMNLGKFIMSKVVMPVDLGVHRVKDLLGITQVAKGLEEFMPGFDQIKEFPGIYSLGLTQTTEERKEYIENGVDPIRKGRYWIAGNTPYTGGKIMYFRPNLYRRVAADVDFSDSKWGSRTEYYNNTWFPNPINPFAPINHFILDPYHYDEKHYRDRPYMQTSHEGNNIPLIGPMFSSTIGAVIKPSIRMHDEYWVNGVPVNKDDESPNSILVSGEYNNRVGQQKIQMNQEQASADYGRAIQTAQISSQNDSYARAQSTNVSKRIVMGSVEEKSGIVFESRNIVPKNTIGSTYMQQDDPLEIYTTPSGGMQIVDIPGNINLWDVNQALREYSIKKVIEADTRVDINNNFAPELAVYNNEDINNGFIYGMGEQYNNFTQLLGMKGFELQAIVTGEANQGAMVVEDSSYAYSMNKDFWDQNLGGFGGDLSEIFRRFVQKRNNDVEYINTVRNTMPEWMPGRDYFTDFKHGDPYSKIDNGEERLPGEGYERMYKLGNVFDLGIGSSFIGRTQEEITLHLLNKDTILDKFGQDITDEGTEMHEEIEKKWLESGLAIDTEQKIEDKANGILGFYDARVHDPTSETGQGFVDIKSVGDKKFKKVVAGGEPLYEHKSQVNYYLWATGNTKSKGYIYYVNRDNPEQTATMSFTFDRKLLEENLNNLRQARENIYSALEKGDIGRGDLYEDLDKFRILADVAPYSEEYRRLSATLARRNDITAEEQEEISQIKERVKEAKEPLRVYPYKFKTSNLQTEMVTVDKIIDNNTVLVDRYGTKHAIKFAGIHVSESNTDKFDKDTTMNEAASREIRKYLRKGKKIMIGFDADDKNKFNKDSTGSIKSVIYANGTNVNKRLLSAGVAKEKEDDDSPAGIRARYKEGEIAFGSTLERVTHWISNNVPIVGTKLLQVRSPYEQYKKREVYGKDFQSWENPVSDFLFPAINESINKSGVGGVVFGAFLGSMFGAKGSKYGKLVGAFIGGSIPLVGKMYARFNRRENEDWIPKNRQKQREVNEYLDMLKYVKNTKLYNEYKIKALKEDKFDVDKFIGSKQSKGVQNKLRRQELTEFKKKVKLDFKHRQDYNFKYGMPKYVEMGSDRKTIISQINKEMAELQSDRKVVRVPQNALKAMAYKQAAEATMYGYDQGESLQNLLMALPKKERQYFKYFVDAPEEEKAKILRVVPEYTRRGLQMAWGLPVDKKPELSEYFTKHGLPDDGWIGWQEDTNMDDVKVKVVHQNNLDLGEFDIWQDQINSANDANIDVPVLNKQNKPNIVKMRLRKILGDAGYDDVQVINTGYTKNRTTFNIYQDKREEVSGQIKELYV